MTTNEFTTPTGRFYVQSYGNGWAYRVTSQKTGESFSVQDDAATTLQAESEDFTNEDVLDQYMVY